MNVNFEEMVCRAARVYREINKPVVKSQMDNTFDFYETEDAENPALTVTVKGSPKAKLCDLLVFGSLALIFMLSAWKVIKFLIKH